MHTNYSFNVQYLFADKVHMQTRLLFYRRLWLIYLLTLQFKSQ